MRIDWFKGARKEEEREERRLQIITATKAFEILTGILEAKSKSKETERNQTNSYTLPAYSEMQADASGYIRALREVCSLVNIQEE